MKRPGIAFAVALLVTGCARGPTIEPTPRVAAVAANIDGIVYIAGGVVRDSMGHTTVASVEAYHPDDRTWVKCAPMATPRAFAAAAAFDGNLYVFGGLDSDGSALASVEVYDPRQDAWNACAPMKAPRSRAAAANHMGYGVLVAGGMDAEQSNVGTVLYYVPTENVWRGFGVLSSARHGLALVDAMDDTERAFAVGGYGAADRLGTLDVHSVGPCFASDEEFEAYQAKGVTTTLEDGTVEYPKRDDLGYGWRPGKPLTTPRGFFGLAAIGRKLYAVGGRCREIPPTEVLDMDAPEAGWTAAAPLPKDLCRFTLVAWDGRLLAVGGETEFGAAINEDVLEYDPAKGAWTVRSPR